MVWLYENCSSSKMSIHNASFAKKEQSQRITSGRRSFSLVVDVASFLERITKVANATPLSELLPLIMILDASNKFLAILLPYLRRV